MFFNPYYQVGVLHNNARLKLTLVGQYRAR